MSIVIEGYLTMAPTLSTKGKEWFIESSAEDRDKGPYYAAGIALQVAVVEVVQARRRGQTLSLSVRDSHGIARECKLLKKPQKETCFQCETLWPKGRSSLPPRCPLREALSPFKD